MFLINSLPHDFRCDLLINEVGRAYPEVTPADLPSSLYLVISLALVFSTHPLVLVLGTDYNKLSLDVFLGTRSMRLHFKEAPHSKLDLYVKRIFLSNTF